jgi:hypothetical protein
MYSASHVGKDEDYTVHDIRKLPSLLFKANINCIEVLFSTHNCVNGYDELHWILDNRHELSIMNLPYLYNACIGTFHGKMSKLEQGTNSTTELVHKFGYDTKQAMCAYRLLDFIIRMYLNNFNFEDAIWYDDSDTTRKFLISIKRGEITKENFDKIVQYHFDYANSLYTVFSNKVVNIKLKDELDLKVKQLVMKGIKNEL